MKFKDEDAFLKHVRATERDFQELEALSKQYLQQLKRHSYEWVGSDEQVDLVTRFFKLAEAFGVDTENTNMGVQGHSGWVYTLAEYLHKAGEEEVVDAIMNIAKYVRLTRLNSWKEIST